MHKIKDHIDIYLENDHFFLSKIKNPLALSIKKWGIQLKNIEGGLRNEKMHKNGKSKRVDHVD